MCSEGTDVFNTYAVIFNSRDLSYVVTDGANVGGVNELNLLVKSLVVTVPNLGIVSRSVGIVVRELTRELNRSVIFMSTYTSVSIRSGSVFTSCYRVNASRTWPIAVELIIANEKNVRNDIIIQTAIDITLNLVGLRFVRCVVNANDGDEAYMNRPTYTFISAAIIVIIRTAGIYFAIPLWNICSIHSVMTSSSLSSWTCYVSDWLVWPDGPDRSGAYYYWVDRLCCCN